jgi:ABC-type branched-subunit amino acid transport system substrate-binding protein
MIAEIRAGISKGGAIRRLLVTAPFVFAGAMAGMVGVGTAASAATASGTPIIIAGEVSVSFFPGVVVGMEAAAKAINAAGGVKGHPIKIENCDDSVGASAETPNADETCARDAVSEHAVAVVGTETAFGYAYDPIVFNAGIPIVAQGAYSTPDLTNKLSFPITNGQASSIDGGFSRLARALGVKTVWVMGDASTDYTSLVPQMQAKEKSLGVHQLGQSLIGASSTSTADMAPYAAAAASSGAKLIFMDIGPTGVSLMQSLLTQGINFQKTAVTADTNVISLQDLSSLGSHENGIYFLGNSYPANYTAYSGVKQYDDEMNAFGGLGKTVPRTEASQQAWAGVHIVADALKKASSLTSASLVKALNHLGPQQIGGMPPFNFSKHAFSTGFQANERVFTSSLMVTRVINGKLVPCVSGFQPLDKPFKITNPSCKLSS